jgi:hypothetical protein
MNVEIRRWKFKIRNFLIRIFSTYFPNFESRYHIDNGIYF